MAKSKPKGSKPPKKYALLALLAFSLVAPVTHAQDTRTHTATVQPAARSESLDTHFFKVESAKGCPNSVGNGMLLLTPNEAFPMSPGLYCYQTTGSIEGIQSAPVNQLVLVGPQSTSRTRSSTFNLPYGKGRLIR